jgi:hypothetical protein
MTLMSFPFLMAEKEQGHRAGQGHMAGQTGKGIELPYNTTSSISIPYLGSDSEVYLLRILLMAKSDQSNSHSGSIA